YVPIDTEYPEDRISYILEDTGLKLLLSNSNSFKDSKERKGVDVILLNNVWEFLYLESKLNLNLEFFPESLAYIIYTSGSTGVPKGVEIQHKSVNAFIHWSYEEFDIESFDKTLFVTSICFDLSIFEIFFTLTTGKVLGILDNGLSIPQYLNTTDRLLVNTVPSVIDPLLGGIDLSSISILNMAGEPIPSTYFDKLLMKVQNIRNLYGPTEYTTYATAFKFEKGEKLSIGKPIGNTSIYILDSALHLCAKGVVGELCIGGDGLARGYL